MTNFINPNVIVISGFPNDTIIFSADPRFIDVSLLKNTPMEFSAIRDISNFVEINVDTGSVANYSVTMISPLYNHEKTFEVINNTFTEF